MPGAPPSSGESLLLQAPSSLRVRHAEPWWSRAAQLTAWTPAVVQTVLFHKLRLLQIVRAPYYLRPTQTLPSCCSNWDMAEPLNQLVFSTIWLTAFRGQPKFMSSSWLGVIWWSGLNKRSCLMEWNAACNSGHGRVLLPPCFTVIHRHKKLRFCCKVLKVTIWNSCSFNPSTPDAAEQDVGFNARSAPRILKTKCFCTSRLASTGICIFRTRFETM